MGRQKITKEKLLVVEGRDEEEFFGKFITELGFEENIHIWVLGGKPKLRKQLNVIFNDRGRYQLTSIGIVLDGDNNPEGAFPGICNALDKVKNAIPSLSIPNNPLEPIGTDPQVTIMILPGNGRSGMLEDLCLESVQSDAAMDCVDEYFRCLRENLVEMPRNIAKSQVRSFLASMGWLEEAEFNLIQSRIGELLPEFPEQPSTARVQAFLASRSKPDLRLGEATQAGYWPLDHQAFDQVRSFLQML